MGNGTSIAGFNPKNRLGVKTGLTEEEIKNICVEDYYSRAIFEWGEENCKSCLHEGPNFCPKCTRNKKGCE